MTKGCPHCKEYRRVLKAIRDYGKSGPRSDKGYPSEIVYDSYAYKRLVNSYRQAAADALKPKKKSK